MTAADRPFQGGPAPRRRPVGALLLGVAGAALIAIEAWVLLLLGSFSAGLLFPTFAIALQIDGVWA